MIGMLIFPVDEGRLTISTIDVPQAHTGSRRPASAIIVQQLQVDELQPYPASARSQVANHSIAN